MEWLDSAANTAKQWLGSGSGPTAPATESEPEDGSSTYIGPGGGSPEAAASAFAHYMEPLEELDLLETAPEQPTERPELPGDEMTAKQDQMTDALARPDPLEVAGVVKSLGAMNDAQRKEALGNLSDDEFDAMMEHLPPEERERLGPLANATDDPKRKLRMWGAAEKAELGRDERNLDQVPAEYTGDDPRLIDRAIKAAREGQVEVDDEVQNAMDQLEDPDLSPAKQKELVDELIKRKEKERAVEKQFNVNLTNDRGGETEDGMPTPRANWSTTQLEQMEVVLDRLPDEAIQENPDLVEIRRAQKDYDKNDDGSWEESGDTMGETSKGRIKILDSTMEDGGDHEGDSSDIAGIHKITAFQQTLAHEVGHVMDKRNRDDSNAVKDKASDENGQFDPTLVPKGGAHTEGNESGDKDTWNYARTEKKDYFAEMYSKSIVAPELMYQDMVKGPQDELQALIDKGAPDEQIAKAKRIAEAASAQHAAMRKNVFHIDEEEDAARESAVEARAEELGLDSDAKEALLADYRAQAKQAMTQEQLDVVAETYQDRAYDY